MQKLYISFVIVFLKNVETKAVLTPNIPLCGYMMSFGCEIANFSSQVNNHRNVQEVCNANHDKNMCLFNVAGIWRWFLILNQIGTRYMCCDPAGSVGSQENWLWDIARKKNASLLFSIVLRIFQLLWLWNHWSNSGGVFSKMYLSWWGLQSNTFVKTWKCLMFDFRLIPLDCITYIVPIKAEKTKQNNNNMLCLKAVSCICLMCMHLILWKFNFHFAIQIILFKVF